MKVFVATRDGMGEDDYSHTVDGEMVRLPVTCDSEECDCGRAMTGIASGGATTTFTVRHLDLSRSLLRQLLWDTLRDDGWVDEGYPEDREWVEKLVELHIDLADTFPEGTLLRLNGDKLYERR